MKRSRAHGKRPRDVAVRAMQDQADTAGRDAFKLIQGMAKAAAGECRATVLPEPAKRLHERLVATMVGRCLRQEPTLCAHLSYGAPAVSWWIPSAPELLRCNQCVQAALAEVAGTLEDRRCDLCRRDVETVFNSAFLVPPMMLDWEGLPLEALPPILVLFGACATCRDRLRVQAA